MSQELTPEEAFNSVNPMPAALEVEKEVVGAIFVNNGLINEAISSISREEFFDKKLQEIYDSFTTLSQNNVELTPTFVITELQTRNKLEFCGGEDFIRSLKQDGKNLSNLESHIKILREKSIARRIINIANKTVKKAHENVSSKELIDDISSKLFKLTGEDNKTFTPIKDITQTVLELTEHIQTSDRKISGLPTGFFKLDEITCGLQKSDLIIIAARPSAGKTSIAMGIAQNVAELEPDSVTAFFSLEMSSEALVQRMLASTALVNSQKLRNGDLTNDEWARLTHAANSLYKLKIFIDDTAAITPMQLRAKALRLQAEQKRLDLIVIDFLQLATSSSKAYRGNRVQEITEIIQELKTIAKELKVPMIVLSQLSRAPETRTDHHPQLSDLRDSGSLEQSADIVLGVYREEAYNTTPDNKGIAELLVLKHRMGRAGDIIHLGFLADYTKFQNLVLG